MSASKFSDVQCEIVTGEGTQITSQDSLKILEFTFGRKPTVEVHVIARAAKFRSRLWLLRHVKRAGIPNNNLTKLYLSLLVPVLDYASIVYRSMLNKCLTALLEGLQAFALKNIHGHD